MISNTPSNLSENQQGSTMYLYSSGKWKDKSPFLSLYLVNYKTDTGNHSAMGIKINKFNIYIKIKSKCIELPTE